MKKPFAIRISETTGRGVFATHRLPPGMPLVKVLGEVVLDEGYGSPYCMSLTENTVIEPYPPARYINHSCDPNCELFSFPADDNELWIYTIKPISASEELTIDYGWPCDAAIPCLCGSPKCRGWIADKKELKEVLRARRKEATSRSRSEAKSSRRRNGVRSKKQDRKVVSNGRSRDQLVDS